MAPVIVLVAVLCQTANALRAGSINRDTPVTKVVELLNRLAVQVADEGAKEAAEYDKYACFCKEQADDKLYAIEKSTEKIEVLDARITKLGAEITILNADIIKLGKRIDAIDLEVKTDTGLRDTDHKKWETADKDMAEAITSCRGAMKALRDSKNDMDGAKLNGGDLLQLKGLLGLASVQAGASPASLQELTALMQGTQQPGQPAKYQYKSNDIIELLAKLLVDFKKTKKDLWDTEFKTATAFDSKMLDLKNEKQFKKESKTVKETTEAAKSEEKSEAEKDKTDEEADKASDEAFQKELTTQCQDKAQAWDQRSTMRANEITMLNEAATKLKTSVDGNYNAANKKLSGLVKVGAHVSHAAGKAVKKLSFMQLSDKNAQVIVVQKALQLLDKQAGILRSPLLSALAAKASLQGDDHFVKVRGLIKDLISKLEADALAEATHKSFCDTEMEGAVTDRDGEQLKVETHSATISEKQAEKEQLLGEIATLSEEIAELTNSLNEQTQLRSEEKAVNDKSIADATAGKTAVGEAITLLTNFYFLQYKPPKSDRNDQTVGDLAPELSYKGDYKGKVDASKSVLGLLEIIEADFDRTIAKVTTDEGDAVTDFTAYKKATDLSIDTKGKSKTTKTGKVGVAEGAIVTARGDLIDAEDLHAKANEELEKLKVMCVEGEESAGERVKKREQEIEALKQAMQILDDFKQ